MRTPNATEHRPVYDNEFSSGVAPRNGSREIASSAERGAPRPTKMGTIATPWHYDAASNSTPLGPNLVGSRQWFCERLLQSIHVRRRMPQRQPGDSANSGKSKKRREIATSHPYKRTLRASDREA
jgi:hypothetical protein